MTTTDSPGLTPLRTARITSLSAEEEDERKKLLLFPATVTVNRLVRGPEMPRARSSLKVSTIRSPVAGTPAETRVGGPLTSMVIVSGDALSSVPSFTLNWKTANASPISPAGGEYVSEPASS